LCPAKTLPVVKKKRLTPLPVNTAAVASTTKEPRVAMIGMRSYSSLSVVQKRVWTKSLFVSWFSPEVTASDDDKSLKDQLQFASFVCTRLKTKSVLLRHQICLGPLVQVAFVFLPPRPWTL
jgi:hypothetical protein